MRDLPWGEQPPIPEYKGSPQKLARRRDLWRSVIMQQLQADMFAVEMAAQLLSLAPHVEARLYYTTMVQDEARTPRRGSSSPRRPAAQPSATRISTSSPRCSSTSTRSRRRSS